MGAGGPQPAAPQQFTQAGGAEPRLALTSSVHCASFPWPLLLTTGACQLPGNVTGPKPGPGRGNGSDQTCVPARKVEAGVGQRTLVVLEAASEGRGQKCLPLSAEVPHIHWGPGMTSVLLVASALPGRLTHPQIQPCCWPWQAQPLPLGGGLLQPPLSFTGVPVRRAGRVTARCTKDKKLVSEKPVLA